MSSVRGFIFILIINGYSRATDLTFIESTDTENEPGFPTSTIAYEILNFFSQDDPVGLPVVSIADPLELALEYNLTSKLSISNHQLWGLSRVQLQSVFVNFSDYRVHVEAKVPVLNFLGQYLWKSSFGMNVYWSSDSSGATNITFQDVELILDGRIILDSEGLLQTSRDEMQIELIYGELSMDFQNLGYMYANLGKLAFPKYIPTLLDWVEDWLHQTVSRSLRSPGLIPHFPDSIHSIDYLMTEVRLYIKDSGRDPLTLSALWIDMGSGIYLLCDDVTLEGLSTLHWTHHGHLRYIDNTFLLSLQMGTQAIKATGKCGIPYVPLLGTSLEIQVDSIKTTFEVHQRTHLRNPPTLRLLDINIGNIEVRPFLHGTVDYLFEAVANIIPNLFKKKFQEEIENVLWAVIQSYLNTLDMLRILEDHVIKQEKGKDQANCNS